MKISVSGLVKEEVLALLDGLKYMIAERPENDNYGELKIGIWKDDD